MEAGVPFPLAMATPYIDNLLEMGNPQDAGAAWRDLEKLGIISNQGGNEPGNLIFNGDFEQTPVNDGLDWRNRPIPDIALDFSDSSAHTGNHCLRIDFTVSRNEECTPLYQFVPVTPKQAYSLTAYVRSQDITSDSGPRLQVFTPARSSTMNVLGDSTVGTTSWHQARPEILYRRQHQAGASCRHPRSGTNLSD